MSKTSERYAANWVENARRLLMDGRYWCGQDPDYIRAVNFVKAAFVCYVEHWRPGGLCSERTLLAEWAWPFSDLLPALAERRLVITDERENRPWTVLLVYAWETLKQMCHPQALTREASESNGAKTGKQRRRAGLEEALLRLAGKKLSGEYEYRLASPGNGGDLYLMGTPYLWTGFIERAFVFGDPADIVALAEEFPHVIGADYKVIATERDRQT